MSDPKWTKAQDEAICHRGSSMIVSAAAGSGKTAVLVERVIRLMNETDVDRMLVVTFTNAAATGMKQKIHKAILKRLEKPASDAEAIHFNRQLSLLSNASINTLHSFCSKFVREHFDALSLSPSVKLGDASKLALMLKDAAETAIDEAYESGDTDFLKFAKALLTKPKDDIISEIIGSVYPFLMSLPNPEKWLRDAASLYESGDADKLLSAPSFTAKTSYLLKEALNIAKENLEKVLGDPDYLYALSHFEADLDYAKRLYDSFAKQSFSDLFDELSNLPQRKTVVLQKKTVALEVSDFLKELRASYTKRLKDITDTIQTINPYSISEILKLQSCSAKAICNLVLRTMEIYNNEKREKEMLDFNDLEHLTLKLLYDGDSPSEIAKAVSDEFDYVIVDEYQDINPVQEAIITAISNGKNNLFMVGDIKQGIYGFRNTVSALFSDKVERYSRNDGGKCVYLSDNFRSRDSVLDFANLIFTQLMSPAMGGTPYTDTEALHKKGSFPDKNSEETTEVYVLSDELFKKDRITAEALFCAKKIHELMDKKIMVTDRKNEGLKEIGYGDIAILLRATKGYASPFCEVLSACGIPVYCDSLSENFLDSMEIRSLISFLKAFSNPLEDVHLLSAFTSPIFGDADYDLIVRIKLYDKDAPLYECMKKFPESDSCFKRVSEFLSFIDYWREKAMNLSVSHLISDFLSETGFAEHMEALKGGDQRLSNIRYLESLADSSYPGAETGGLYSFLKHLDKHSKTKAGLSSPKILPDSAELVQVTTIHKSKGLEYPIVILPGTGKNIKPKAYDGAVNFHRDFGIGMPYKNAEQSVVSKSPVYELIKSVKLSEALSEELRVLYVALTRAIDKTIVIGFPEKENQLFEYAALSEKITEISIPEGIVSEGKTYLDWIMLALTRKDSLMPETSSVKVEIINKINGLEEAKKEESTITPKEPRAEICESLSYRYPFLAHSDIFSKMSVTELKRLENEADENAHKPFVTKRSTVSFDDTKTALKAGTITHYILENTDFSERDAKGTIEKMLENRRLTEEELSIAKVSDINRFLNSPLCEMLRSADRILKELPFNIHIDAKNLSEDAEGEKIQLQGTIDCLAIFGDSILIIDFKTDNITSEQIKERAELYRPQLEYYKKGASALFPDKDISASVYFLSLGIEERF